MNVLAKIRALFTHKDEPKEMTLAAAEIRNNKVYLHPADDASTTICMKASSVDIHINPGTSLRDRDFLIFHSRNLQERKLLDVPQGEAAAQEITPDKKSPHSFTPADNAGRAPQAERYKSPMKTISFRVYPEEYDALMETINSNGYRKAEYLLACVYAAKKKSMESVYVQYYDAYQERR